MRPILCLAIDDEPMALSKLETYIRKIPFLQLVGLCDNPFEAMQVLAEQPVDALFIDINMPDLNGLDFIASMENPPLVVFTTAYAEYAVESYRLSATDYLLKPFDFNDFQRAANKLLKQFKRMMLESSPSTAETHLLVKEGYKYVNVRIDEICYVKGMNEYVQLCFPDRKPVVAHIAMRQIIEKLPNYFLQVHRSYIVNMLRIKEIERLRIIMADDTRIAVSESFKPAFTNYLRLHALTKNERDIDTDETTASI